MPVSRCITMSLFAPCSVSGLASIFPAIPLQTGQGITRVLLGYLTKSASVMGEPGKDDTVHLATCWLVRACTWA